MLCIEYLQENRTTNLHCTKHAAKTLILLTFFGTSRTLSSHTRVIKIDT